MYVVPSSDREQTAACHDRDNSKFSFISAGKCQKSVHVSEKVSLNKPENNGSITKLQYRVPCGKVVKAYEILTP